MGVSELSLVTFPEKKITRFVTCFHAGILFGLFDPEDAGDMFLQNFG
jgi:hypothetical protein